MKTLLLALLSLSAVSCAQTYNQIIRNMSAEELAAHNANLPESQQISCIDIRKGVNLQRRVCSSNFKRLARIARYSGLSSDPNAIPGGYVQMNNRSGYESRRGNLPQVYFSAPPPGFTRPIIHVRDGRNN